MDVDGGLDIDTLLNWNIVHEVAFQLLPDIRPEEDQDNRNLLYYM